MDGDILIWIQELAEKHLGKVWSWVIVFTLASSFFVIVIWLLRR